MSTSVRLPSLDGWRALSIILVLGSHCIKTTGFPPQLTPLFTWVFNGNLGVRFFFVLSGFLITWLLLQEHMKTGAVDLRKFYIRRALRILPVYAAFLLVAFALQLFTPWHQRWITWLGNLTFTTNFVPHSEAATGHLWSLAVEEQFYLVWPLLLTQIGLKRNGRTMLFILLLPVLIAPICRIITYKGYSPLLFQPFFARFSFFNFFDSLAIGCIAAIILTKKGPEVAVFLARFKWPSMLLALLMIAVPVGLNNLFFAGFFYVPLGHTLEAAGFSILLLQSIFSPANFKPLNWAIVQKLGVLSYSIYIWQQIFWQNPQSFGWPQVWFMSFPGWMLAALVVAVVSFYAIEKPLLGLRACYRGN